MARTTSEAMPGRDQSSFGLMLAAIARYPASLGWRKSPEVRIQWFTWSRIASARRKSAGAIHVRRLEREDGGIDDPNGPGVWCCGLSLRLLTGVEGGEEGADLAGDLGDNLGLAARI